MPRIRITCPHRGCHETFKSLPGLNDHWNTTHFNTLRKDTHATKVDAELCATCFKFINPDASHKCPEKEFVCPHSQCHHRATTIPKLNKHWATAHPNADKKESHASRLNLGLCKHCSTFQSFSNIQGVLAQHGNCPNQSQPNTPSARRQFAQETDALHESAHNNGVQSLLAQEEPLPNPQIRKRRGPWKEQVKQYFADFGVASTQGDTTRMDSLLKTILQSPLQYRPIRPFVANPKHAPSRIRRSIGILQGTGDLIKRWELCDLRSRLKSPIPTSTYYVNSTQNAPSI